MNSWTLKIVAFVFVGACATTAVNGINFGTDTSEFANDNECDDPRFVGGGMANGLNNENIGRDATDCQTLFAAERIRLQRSRDQWDIAQCREISYGNNSSEWARNGECDDPRFTGPGIDEQMNFEDQMSDAADCRALCDSGAVWLK